MRGCVAHNDLWPWPIFSRSFGLDLENRVRFVASTVLDGFFLYLAQMITIIRGCVACYVFFRIWKFEFLANFWNFSALTLKKKCRVLDGFFPYFAQMITSMRGCVAYNDLWPWPISSRSFGLGLVVSAVHSKWNHMWLHVRVSNEGRLITSYFHHVSNDKSTERVPSLFWVSFLISQVNCGL